MPHVPHQSPQDIKKPVKTESFLTFSEIQHMQQNYQKNAPQISPKAPKTWYGGKRKAQVNFVSLGFGESNRIVEVAVDSFSFDG